MRPASICTGTNASWRWPGGVNLYLHPRTYVDLCALRMLSPDGRCKSFGKGGDGFVPGEGVGVVVLKPLSQAVADGDQIHAVIRGTSINHGGKTNGYTVPNPNAQKELVRAALAKAGIERAVGQLHRGAWHRDGAWRSDRDHGTDAGVCAGHGRRGSSARSAR